MARGQQQLPKPRQIKGKIGFAPADGVFLGAWDIFEHVPLTIRIAEVVEYPAGTVRGGYQARAPFLALHYEAKAANGEWKRARKPLPLNRTNHVVLYYRFGEDASWWVGMEITLVLEPTRNPGGGRMVYGIRIAPAEDEHTEEQIAEKMRRAKRHECPYAPVEPEDEPPEDWEGSVPIDDGSCDDGG